MLHRGVELPQLLVAKSFPEWSFLAEHQRCETLGCYKTSLSPLHKQEMRSNPSPAMENQLIQQGASCKTRATLPKGLGFQPIIAINDGEILRWNSSGALDPGGSGNRSTSGMAGAKLWSSFHSGFPAQLHTHSCVDHTTQVKTKTPLVLPCGCFLPSPNPFSGVNGRKEKKRR